MVIKAIMQWLSFLFQGYWKLPVYAKWIIVVLLCVGVVTTIYIVGHSNVHMQLADTPPIPVGTDPWPLH